MLSSLIFDAAVNEAVGAITGKAPITADKQHYPAQSSYQARGMCKAAMEATDAEVLISGPSRTGKTRANLEFIHQSLWQYPGARALMVRKTRASLSETAMQTYEDHVLGPGNAIAEGPQRPYRQFYEYPNGSRFVVGGMDKASRIMSSEYDIIYVPEAIELGVHDHEALLSRLSNGVMPFQQIRADTNPDKPTHWLKVRCDAGITRMFRSDHKDNPVLWDIEANDWTERGRAYIAKLDHLTGPRKQRLRYGNWVQAEGAIYENWDESIHLINRDQMPTNIARHIRVIDFGFTNPFVCQWWAIDSDGRMYLYREIYMTQRTVHIHSAQIRALSEGETYEATIADHDAEDRATLREEGITTIPARKEVTVGIQKTQERLNKAADGKPRLFIVRDSRVERDESLTDAGKPTSTVEEITGYIWQPGADGKPLKEEPLKQDDHGMDDMRYGVMYLDKSSKVRAATW